MSISDTNKAWVLFLESPIAELEGFGIETKFITQLERDYGIYIKHLHTATRADLIGKTRNFGNVSATKLSNALRAYWEHLQDEVRATKK